MKIPEEYYPTNIRPLMQIVARIVKNDPSLADDSDRLWATINANVDAFKDKSKCEGCGRSMKVSIYEADLLDGLLILKMAQQVKQNMKEGMPFTQANKVHIPTLRATQGILKRQTKCDYLGFIKQSDELKYSGYWVLTSWAWKALRGEEVPKAVKYWEGKILGRSKATTTLGKMFHTHRVVVQQAILRRKSIRSDHTAVFEDYDPNDWGGYGE